MWNVFEQPWTLLITAAVLVPLVAVISIFIQAKYKRRLWLLPLLVAVMGPALDFAVSTDREKIEDVIDAAVTAMENEDCEAIAALLAENYKDSAHPSKAAITARCKSVLREPFVDTAICQLRQIDITPETADITVDARILFDKNSDAVIPGVQSTVEISLRKTKENRWLINAVEIQAIRGNSASWQDVDYRNW